MGEETAKRMWANIETLAANIVALKIENQNRTLKIQRMVKGLGYKGDIETDKREPKLTEDLGQDGESKQ